MEEDGHALVEDGFHGLPDLGVAELGLGLALELGFSQLDRYDGCQAFAGVLAGEVGLFLLDEGVLACVVVERPGESGAESGHVGPALGGVDAVGERQDGLGVAVVVLDSGFDEDVFVFLLVVERGLVDGLPVPVDVLDQVGDTAVEVEGAFDVAGAVLSVPLGDEVDFQPLVQEGNLFEVGGEGVEVEVGVSDYLVFRLKVDCGAGGLGASVSFDVALGLAAAVVLGIGVSVSLHLGGEL